MDKYKTALYNLQKAVKDPKQQYWEKVESEFQQLPAYVEETEESKRL